MAQYHVPFVSTSLLKKPKFVHSFYLCETADAEYSSLLKCKAFRNSEQLIFICSTWIPQHTAISFSPKY